MDQPSITILSRRDKADVGWIPIDDFENLLSETTGARIYAPSMRKKNFSNFFNKITEKIYSDMKIGDDIGSSEILFVVARQPAHLAALNGIKNLRRRFKAVIGYVIDSYFLIAFPEAVLKYDHIFVTSQEACDYLKKKFSVSCSVLRQGFDCLTWASVSPARCIDVIGYGRQPPSFHKILQNSFHRPESKFLYLHSPIGAKTGPNIHIERSMMLKLLQKSNISLAFNLMVEPSHARPVAQFVTSRWLESLATGCIVVGRKPVCEMADDMLSWTNSTLEAPDSPLGFVDMIVDLLRRPKEIDAMRKENVKQMLLHHDWRYRIRDFFRHLNLSLPSRASEEINKLNRQAATIYD